MKLQQVPFRQLVIAVVTMILIIFGFVYYPSVLAAIGMIWKALVPFFVGLIFAFVVNLPMSYIEPRLFKKKNPLSRPISLVLAILLILAILGFFVVLVTPELVDSILHLAKALPGYWHAVQNDMAPQFKAIPQLETFLTYIKNAIPVMTDSITTYLTTNINAYLNTSATYVQILLVQVSNFLVSIIFASLVLLYKEQLSRNTKDLLLAYFPPQVYEYVHGVGVISQRIFTAFITENCLSSFLLGLLCYIVFLLFGFQYALLTATIMALFNLVPIVGKSIGTTIGLLIVLVSQGYTKAIMFFVILFVIKQVMSIIVKPRIIGNHVGLPPVWMFVVTTISAQVFGLLGIFLCIPISGVIYALIANDVVQRLYQKKLPVESQANAMLKTLREDDLLPPDNSISKQQAKEAKAKEQKAKEQQAKEKK